MSEELRKMRNALGRFATGVTVITGNDCYGKAVGITISSFNTVSLEPPLVLWSLGRRSKNLNCFMPGTPHNIHVLSAEQQGLAEYFASSDTNGFSGLDCKLSSTNVILLPNCLAYFECVTQFWYEGGDHITIVARVHHFDSFDGEPLIFYRGQFVATEKIMMPLLE